MSAQFKSLFNSFSIKSNLQIIELVKEKDILKNREVFKGEFLDFEFSDLKESLKNHNILGISVFKENEIPFLSFILTKN